jgi:glycosyltransferase involved in cell wall biosynthesis
MRIGIDYRPAAVAPKSGIGRQVIGMAEALLARPGARLTRFSAAPLDHPERNLEGFCLPPWPSPLNGLHRPRQRFAFEARFLPQALRQQQVDIYIATINMGLPLPPRPPGIRYVLLLHDLFQITLDNHHATPLRRLVYRGIDRFSIHYALRVADRVWTPSAHTAQEARRLFPFCAGKLRILPNHVAAFPVSPSLPQGLPSRFWLLVGTREPRKNIPWFIDAWRHARTQNANIPDLVLVGHVDDLPPAQRKLPGIRVLQDLDDAKLLALYQSAERLWQPSRAEGFGMPVIEALGAGTPVAVARGSALDEIAPPHTPRFDPDDAAALVRLMLALGDSTPAKTEKPEETAKACRAWAARYDTDAYRARLGELLEELCP